MGDPDVGTVLGGKFVIEGVLGRGGMGVVYAARHRELDQRVAIKCLLPHALSVPDVVERFAREARAAAKIQGEHVARVIDVGRFEDGTPFIVMEHLQGQDLSYELASRGHLPVADAVRYLLETCEALAQAHAMRIVHRDLKPSNLFLAETPGRRPIVKVLDFGISKVVDAQGAPGLTKTSSIMGTPYYMSPEQLLSSKSVDERSDIWALGVILYELLVGQPPFTAETAPEIIAKIVQNAPTSPRATHPELPAGLEAVILRCLRSRPDERYANVAELAMALQPFAAVEDRGSVAAIARVLGVRESALDATLEHTHPAAGASPAALPAALAQTPGVASASSRPAPMGTAPSLAMSAIGTTGDKKGRGWVMPALVALVLVAAAGTVVGLRSRSHVAAATPDAVPASPAPVAPSVSALVRLETLPPLDPAPSGAASANPVASTGGRPAPHPTTPATSRPGPAATPSIPAAPPAAAPTSHNPLDLPIK